MEKSGVEMKEAFIKHLEAMEIAITEEKISNIWETTIRRRNVFRQRGRILCNM